MPTRERVYQAIDGERNYQEEHVPLDGRILSVGDEILLLESYLQKARDAWTTDFDNPELTALEMLRKVAGVAVRCLEHHGAPERNYVVVEEE